MSHIHGEVILGGGYALFLLAVSVGFSAMGARSDAIACDIEKEFHPKREAARLPYGLSLLLAVIAAVIFFGLGLRHWSSHSDVLMCAVGELIAAKVFLRNLSRFKQSFGPDRAAVFSRNRPL